MKIPSSVAPPRFKAYPNTDSHPTWSPDSRRVVAEVGSDTVIVSRDNASEQTSLGPQSSWVNFPDWSPDGEKLAFSAFARREGQEHQAWGIYTCDPDGTNFEFVCPDGKEPEWNPQGDKISYQMVKSGVRPRLAVVNSNGSEAHSVSSGGLLQNDWSWDPRGQQIAYETYSDGQFQIRLVDTSGDKDRVLTDGEGGIYKDRTPEWSPQGDKILFERHNRVTPTNELWVVNPETGEDKRIANFRGRSYDATWSPDGSKIAFVSNMDDDINEYDLYVMDADGANLERISALPGDEYAPSWSPDGSAIAFTRIDWGKQDEGRYSLHIHEFEE